jgi:cysteine desulfurase
MERIYLDNAATTPIDPEVLEAMWPFMKDHFGNPSSIHTHGRATKAAIEKSRKTVAEILGTSPSEIFFTSGGTEADNMAICGAVEQYGIKTIITSALEHHAVLHCAEHLRHTLGIEVLYVNHDKKGVLDLDHLQHLLSATKQPALVSLMHGNNEIGNLNPMERIGEICAEYGAIFHSDTVQTVGHFKFNLSETPVHFIVGAAHKFHGPKGVGFIYIRHDKKIPAFVQGGAQERNMRGGTENVYGIIGLAKALELANTHYDAHKQQILELKQYTIAGLKETVPDVQFNGTCTDIENSLYTVISASMPASEWNEMLLENLDINKISASGGSACSSGSSVGSHVIKALNPVAGRSPLRISLSKYNTKHDIDALLKVLASMYQPLQSV